MNILITRRIAPGTGASCPLEILEVLRDGEQCVCHLESVLGLRQAYMSQQLMALRKVGLVAHRKDGLRMYYRVLDPGVYAILDVARSLVSRRRPS